MIKEILNMSLNELKEGYTYNIDKSRYECLFCNAIFEEGEIFTFDNRLFVAERAIKEHIELEHGGVLGKLLDTDKKYTGLTEKQKNLLIDISSGLTDKEISKKNGVATATIRHQRFMFREKAKQAKMYMAIYESVELAANSDTKHELVKAHVGATMVDERYVLTVEENKKIIMNYFEEGDTLRLKILPSKEKKKIVVLRKISESFDPSIKYSEKELNEILKSIYDDIATIRRYLIQYGFLDRTKDGSQYWVKNDEG